LRLHLVVTHHDQGDWDLVIKVDGVVRYSQAIGKDFLPESRWKTIGFMADGEAGKMVKLELLNQPSGWSFEGGYWAEINLIEDE